MIQVSVLYPFSEDEDFNFDYYKVHHMDLVKKIFKDDVWDIKVEKGIEGGRPGAKPAFVAICRLRTHSIDTWHEHIGRHFDEFVSDIPNFTKIQPKILFSEVLKDD